MTPPDCINKGYLLLGNYARNWLRCKAWFVTLIIAGAGCASPAARFNDNAESLGLELGTTESNAFRHLLVSNRESGKKLHIYFGGDGSPWIGGRVAALDPTPKKAIALGLLALDPQPAIFVGRPCYHDQPGACSLALITSARYSATVVESMEAVVRTLIAEHPSLTPILIGYSGGGVLALLVAERIIEVTQVVTVATNLDTGAWVELHGYLPLTGSINPAERVFWRSNLKQLHLSGRKDRNVPPATIRRFRIQSPNARVRFYDRFDHSCCWQQIWPEILNEL
ncbi:MAG: hypothetical protein O7G86_11640 [Gammaproteobacteria bacterium]|nr:hypothetical protein [Gammaproteobacteria bacterium]